MEWGVITTSLQDKNALACMKSINDWTNLGHAFLGAEVHQELLKEKEELAQKKDAKRKKKGQPPQKVFS